MSSDRFSFRTERIRAGRPSPPTVLRATLGSSNTWSGRGIGVAVIDSGLEMSTSSRGGSPPSTTSPGRHSRRTPTTTTATARTSPARSAALARCRPHASIAASRRTCRFTILKVLDKNGAGLDERRHSRRRLRRRKPRRCDIDIINLSLGHPIYEPAASDPLVQAVERACGPASWSSQRPATSGRTRTTGAPGLCAASRRLATRRPPSPSVPLQTEDTVTRSDERIADYSSRGPDLVRRVRQARHRRARAQHRRRRRPSAGTLYPELSTTEGGRRRLHAHERHEHGDRGGDRRHRADARGEPVGERLSL